MKSSSIRVLFFIARNLKAPGRRQRVFKLGSLLASMEEKDFTNPHHLEYPDGQRRYC